MTGSQTANETLDRDFLDMRHGLLDIAAALDRIDRGRDADAVRSDSRMRQMAEAIGILAESQPARAERVQMIFSRSYDPNWRE